MEVIKDIEHVRPEYPERKAGRPRSKLTGEEFVIFVGIVNKNVFSVIFYEILFLAES
jgi:hypothetical protein